MRMTLRALRALLSVPAGRFHAALDRPAAAQDAVAERIAADLSRTAFGREHGVTSAAGLRANVPPRTWEELSPWLDRHRAGERDVVTTQPIVRWVPTSGSTGAAKLVPHTAALRGAFSQMFVVWVHDVLQRGPDLDAGRAYVSVSPTLDDRPGTTEDDADYLDGWLRPLVSPFLVAPPGASKARDPDRFWQIVAEGLIDAADLEVVSVWNPTFFTILLDRVTAQRHALAPRLDARRRAALLADPVDWTGVWPRLRFVSCWADGHAAPAAAQLARLLPHAQVQPKGLLATEAPVTVPLIGSPASVPLVDSVLIELLDDAGALHPLHAGRDGETYELVLSQGAGLVRYRIGDRVRVAGRHRATPCLQFVGRTGGVSDLVGEKLHPAFVEDALAQVAGDAPFRMLVPLRAPRDRYALLLDQPAAADTAARLDAALSASHHYRHARLLGQLGPAEVISSPALPDAWLRAAAASGARLGDVKHRFLLTQPADGWLAPWSAP